MKTQIVFATLLVTASAPALAQYPGQYGRDRVPFGSNYLPSQLIDELGAQVGRYAGSGIISRSEAQRWNAEVSGLRQLERRYSRGGISDRERTDLVRRANAVRQRLLATVDPRYARALLRPPPDEYVRRPPRIDNTNVNRLEGDRPLRTSSFQNRLYQDDERDMNDLRGPAPEKHEEGD